MLLVRPLQILPLLLSAVAVLTRSNRRKELELAGIREDVVDERKAAIVRTESEARGIIFVTIEARSARKREADG
jgi:hypothetical protein